MGRRGPPPNPNSKRTRDTLRQAVALGVASRAAPEANHDAKAPDPPADIAARCVAAAFWKSHAASLASAGRLCDDNAECFAIVAHLYADCRELATQLAAEGWITATDKGQAASPVARLLRDARRDFLAFAREYGLTPAAEARFPPEVEHVEEDAAEAALRAFTG